MSYDDIQRYDSTRGEELNMSRSTSLSTKKYSMYTGLSPKEKIEYNDYNDLRCVKQHSIFICFDQLLRCN